MEAAKTILVKIRVIRRHEKAADLLEHDSAFNEVVEKLKEATETADRIFQAMDALDGEITVSAEASDAPVTAIGMPSAMLQLLKETI